MKIYSCLQILLNQQKTWVLWKLGFLNEEKMLSQIPCFFYCQLRTGRFFNKIKNMTDLSLPVLCCYLYGVSLYLFSLAPSPFLSVGLSLTMTTDLLSFLSSLCGLGCFRYKGFSLLCSVKLNQHWIPHLSSLWFIGCLKF